MTQNFVDYAEIFIKFSRKCHHHFEVNNFLYFWHFPTWFRCFLPADTADKKYIEV